MVITMKRQVFESLDYDMLGWECIKPAMMQARGKDSTVKLHVYSQLNKGQRALFVFRAYYNHAVESLDAFYWWSRHFLTQSTWSEIKTGLQYFDDDAMLKLLEEIERCLEDNPELCASVSRIYSIFQETAPATLKLIGEYIRNNPEEFVHIED